MPEKKEVKPKTKKVQKRAVKNAATATKTSAFSLPVFDLKGKEKGTIALPKEIFGVSVPPELIAQVVRVYHANKRQGGAIAQTRSEVTGSGKKVWRQKGTGRARHHERNAPIFVGGGVSHGPRPRDFSMSLNKKMRRKALFGALSHAFATDKIRIVDGLETLTGKTKELTTVLKLISCKIKSGALGESVLITTPGKSESVYRAGRNIERLSVCEAQKLTTYLVASHQKLVVSKSAIETLKDTFIKRGTTQPKSTK